MKNGFGKLRYTYDVWCAMCGGVYSWFDYWGMFMNEPVLLLGLRSITSTFHVGRSSVMKWKELGAPIAFYNRRYSAELNILQEWLVEQSQRNDLKPTIQESDFIKFKK